MLMKNNGKHLCRDGIRNDGVWGDAHYKLERNIDIMNVYNEAHNLARAIRESEEFKQYDAIKKKVAENPSLTQMLNDFQAKQFEMQAKQLMGEAMGDGMTAHIQELYNIMMRDPLSAQYLQCEVRFSLMINDVYKILGEVMGITNPGAVLNLTP